jgi:ubiquinone/menaquinone biosynthesis C-methylase UbiE
MPQSFVGPFAPIQDQINCFFPPHTHPYRVLEREILANLTTESAVLDIGCGRSAPTLSKLKGHVRELYGIDLVEFSVRDPELHLLKQDVCNMEGVASGSIDLAFSRSVMEHVRNPRAAFSEIYRVLKDGGKYIFLTPGSYDYATVISKIIPNKFHPKIVRYVEGRDESDTFPAYYRSNSKKAIKKYAKEFGFTVTKMSYLGQYPSYFSFSRPLFWTGCIYEMILSRFEHLHFLRGWILAFIEKPFDGPALEPCNSSSLSEHR